jgi:hypothetical protein
MADQMNIPSTQKNDGTGRVIMMVLAGIAVCICLAVMIAIGGSVYYLQQEASAATATDSARSTGTQVAHVTATSAASATRMAVTEHAQASATARAEAAYATATKSAELIDHYTSGRRLNKLSDLSLRHYPDNSYIETYWLGVTVASFVVQATFENPDRGDWDYGFVFRSMGTYRDFRLLINSDKQWLATQIRSREDYSVIANGDLDSSMINTGGQNSNILLLVADGKSGLFFLNGILVSRLDLSAELGKGALAVGTGFYDGYEAAGEYTRVTDVTIWGVP